MTLFKLLCQNCSLSLPQAAEYLNVNPSRAKEWWMGRRLVPEGVVDELYALARQQETEAIQRMANKRIEGISPAVKRHVVHMLSNEMIKEMFASEIRRV